ncbi:hypothetical protein N825_25350 [Skermanella stibiiresistens SB22]|uniref:Terminase n=1 Tax=Skermanella stibiiresistens SB22 TaxID=1385369 RepID=W9GZ58_9PROT|nr:terminase gpA endonuclease subunit [Skermanella stibiiresistens]EWY36763.1 hypothetical protein N825_25350 [Skermanella stibiiresistens SB22]
MRPNSASALPGLANGATVFAASLARGLRPPPRVTVSQWAADKRIVGAESGSPHPGPWDNDRVPHLVEPMDCLSFSDPSTHIVILGPAQSAKSEGGVNLVGYVIDVEPAPVLIVLPSLDEGKKYNKTKLQPTIDETPSLRDKVRDDKSRDATGSTALMKRYRGGFCIVTGANSSKGLQMISARVLIREEISEWPFDVDGRGDPMDLSEDRLTAWRQRGVKILDVSTPGLAGYCRISANEAKGDRRRRYLPCPACGWYQQLEWRRLRYLDEDGRRVPAHFRCQHCDGRIEHHHKLAMNRAGVWLPTYVDDDAVNDNPAPPACIAPEMIDVWRGRSPRGRQPSYAFWAVINPFTSWEDLVKDYLDRKDTPSKLKTFTQQKLAEPWEETVDVPEAQLLVKVTADFPVRRLPPGAAILTGMCDVQGDRLEWSVYAWGPYMSGWEIDWGVIPGDTTLPGVWEKLWQVVRRQYPNAAGKLWPVDAFGIDSGYNSNQVYMFSRKAAHLYATDGRAGALRPALGAASPVDVSIAGKTLKGGAQIWPIGTHPMKAEVYGALGLTLAGADEHGAFRPGALIYSKLRTIEHFEQLTAEHLVKSETDNRTSWQKRKANQPNEALDIAVGARALAYHVGAGWLDDAGWRQLMTARQAPPPAGHADLFSTALAAPSMEPSPGANAVRPEDAPAAEPAPPAPAPAATPLSNPLLALANL